METKHLIRFFHFAPLLLQGSTIAEQLAETETIINHQLGSELAEQNPRTHSWKLFKLEDGVATFQGEQEPMSEEKLSEVPS